jgi:hypothetical protein
MPSDVPPQKAEDNQMTTTSEQHLLHPPPAAMTERETWGHDGHSSITLAEGRTAALEGQPLQILG